VDLRCKYSAGNRIAITGSTGYIGRQLIASFPMQDFVAVDFDKVPAGALIIHLAANVSNTWEAFLENIRMDILVLELTNKMHRGLIYGSSNNVYPYTVDCRPEEKTRGDDCYAAAKVAGEQLLLDMVKKPLVVLRIADVFGCGQRHGNFFKALERSLQERTDIALFGLGLKRRTYIHVVELVRYINWIAVQGFDLAVAKKILNIGYSDSASVFEIVNQASVISGLSIVNKAVELENSASDIRTMQVCFLPGYVPIWCDFKAAFLAYIDDSTNAMGDV
jgi:nucleoside-diphosphate-sugar epimerase